MLYRLRPKIPNLRCKVRLIAEVVFPKPALPQSDLTSGNLSRAAPADNPTALLHVALIAAHRLNQPPSPGRLCHMAGM